MDGENAQQCGMCREHLPMESFSPSYRGKRGTWCRDCFAAYHRGERDTRAKRHDALQCAHCGQSYIPRQLKSGAAYCSRKCKDDAKNAAAKAARLAAKQSRQCLYCSATIGPSRTGAPVTRRIFDLHICAATCSAATKAGWNSSHLSVKEHHGRPGIHRRVAA